MAELNRMHVRPAQRPGGGGRLVVGFPGREGAARHLDDAGELVPRTAYWMRRLNVGDVELVSKPSGRAQKPATTRKPSHED